MIVRIRPDSIRRNPRAFQTTTVVNGVVEANFTVRGAMPAGFKEDEDYFVMVQSDNYMECSLVDPSRADELSKHKNISVYVNHNLQTIHHAPESEYLYEYENPDIKCRACLNMVPVNSIEEDWNDDMRFQICPKCKTVNSFEEIEYQSIDEIIKDFKP